MGRVTAGLLGGTVTLVLGAVFTFLLLYFLIPSLLATLPGTPGGAGAVAIVAVVSLLAWGGALAAAAAGERVEKRVGGAPPGRPRTRPGALRGTIALVVGLAAGLLLPALSQVTVILVIGPAARRADLIPGSILLFGCYLAAPAAGLLAARAVLRRRFEGEPPVTPDPPSPS